MSPIIEDSIKHKLIKDVNLIYVRSIRSIKPERSIFYCEIITRKTVELGFVFIKDIITGKFYEINPKHIVHIEKVNVTKIDFSHNNRNFKSGKCTVFYRHNINTELEMSVEYVNDETDYDPMYELKKIHDNHYLLKMC